jgi:hypothetical protein
MILVMLVALAVVGPQKVFAQVATQQPVTIGAQWISPPSPVNCTSPNLSGWTCLFFPNGGYIYNITWESTLKNSTDALWSLVLSATPSSADQALFRTFQQGVGVILKQLTFDNRPVQIPAGWYIWVALVSDFPSMSSELNVTIWTDPVPVQHYCPISQTWVANAQNNVGC